MSVGRPSSSDERQKFGTLREGKFGIFLFGIFLVSCAEECVKGVQCFVRKCQLVSLVDLVFQDQDDH